MLTDTSTHCLPPMLLLLLLLPPPPKGTALAHVR
jgi:hypothetical protein